MIDARLIVPAASAWLGAVAVLAWGWWMVAACTVTALTGWVAASRMRRWDQGVGRGLVLSAAFVLLGAVAGVALTWRLAPQPFAAWVEDRATAVVVAAITGEPDFHPPDPSRAEWSAGSYTLAVQTQRIWSRGVLMSVELPLEVRVPSRDLLPPRGTVVVMVGRLAPLPVRKGVAASLRVAPASIEELARPGPLDRLATSMRSGLTRSLDRAPPDAAALVSGLALGDDSAQEPELTSAMRESGLSHLTAVSGGNVAIVVGVIVGLATLARLRLPWRVMWGLAGLVYYAFLVGPEPSVLRASVMGAVVLLGVLVGGRRGGPAVLATAVLALIVIQPSLALSWGFALSAFATGGIVLLVPGIQRWADRMPGARRLPPALVTAVSLTIAAQAATLPLLIAMGGAAGWVAVPANLAAMPAVAPVTVLGLAAAALSPLLPALADVAATLAAWPARGIAMIAFAAPRLPWADWPVGSWPQGWAGALLLGGVLAAVLLVLEIRSSRLWQGLPRLSRRLMPLVVLTGLVAVLLRPPSTRGWPPPDWLVLMCDVGQGDALLLRSAPAEAVVIDTGSDAKRVDDCLAEAGIQRVPAVILTHFHADHVSGLAGVLAGRPVGAVLTTPLEDPVGQAALVRDVLARTGQRPEPITAGDARRIGQVSWRALWPRRIIASGSAANNASIVLVAEVAGHSILLTGDIEPEAQRAVLDDVRTLDLDIVKVPHHGSRHQDEDFARAAWAPLALVSVGSDNDYGHPAAETVTAYAADGALVLRSDLLGDVAVVPAHGDGRLGVVSRSGMLLPP